MNIQFYAKNVELTQNLKDYVDEKIGSLDKYNFGITECKVDISKSSHHQKGDVYRFEVNITSSHKKGLIRIVVDSNNIMSAIDEAKDKLGRQITKYKK
ncbi:MAG: ribosome-associated translation inhibitor RaiA [Patescibacteria group bacterium]|nr:ribosome-associated translation inhibitor RaiA [Patescibacteria group bacterium]MDD4304413.1 ribosome-associated translation inhibitor RaiA [Patescibacteria group bacterium]MDD4695436.1 ribosome-associated translation inhibitor RaiA [Patescibacteria group bacterium]